VEDLKCEHYAWKKNTSNLIKIYLMCYSKRLHNGGQEIEVQLPAGEEDFYPLQSVQTGPAAHPESCIMATGDSFSGHEADHSPPSSVQVKYGGSIPPFPNMSHSMVLN
jgi:hypothetical protein